ERLPRAPTLSPCTALFRSGPVLRGCEKRGCQRAGRSSRLRATGARRQPGIRLPEAGTILVTGAVAVAMRRNILLLAGPRNTPGPDRKSTRLNSSHVKISYA